MTDPRVTPSLTSLGDADLMRLVARRSESALVELYRRYGRRVYPLIRRIVGNDGLADEVVQDVFVRLWNRPEQYRPEGGQLAARRITELERVHALRLVADGGQPQLERFFSH